MLLSMTMTSLLTAQETDTSSNEDSSWRFITLADWHSAEKFVMGNRRQGFQPSVDENIATFHAGVRACVCYYDTGLR